MRYLILLLLLATTACEPEPGPPPAAEVGVVDSVIPVAEALARFRADIGRPAGGLSGGAPTAEALAREIVTLAVAGDTLGFERLALDRAEFAWIYYEASPLSRPPYELPPALAWFQMQQANRTGVLRMLREFGGRAVTVEGLRCPGPVQPFGEGEILPGCRIALRIDGTVAEMRLFGALLLRDGRVKVVSFANDF